MSFTLFKQALPFYLIFLNIPLIAVATVFGGVWIAITFFYFLVFISLLDRVSGLDEKNLDPLTKESALIWYKMVSFIWPFAQFALIYFVLWQLTSTEPAALKSLLIMSALGISSGIGGFVIAHELIHQSNRFERTLGDLLLCMVLYGHFRTEHILVHHRYVATPRDTVTARYNENIYRFFLRIIPHSFMSAWNTEAARLATKNKPYWHKNNPFYLYFALQLLFLILAYFVGGGMGVGLFLLQATIAILLLETTNYMEHYGLCRLHLGNGKYEHVHPRHSWNANNRFTNYLMINLQRHSDHHYKPSRRYPLLQAYNETEAPQLPYGYILMGLIAFFPNIWRKIMNPRVRRWRSMYYPQITDWSQYNKGNLPWPK